MDLLTVPHELTTPEREAIGTHFLSLIAAKANPEDRRSFAFNLPNRPPLWVKHDSDMRLEASTQHFFHTLSKDDESAPRVPKVFDVFTWPLERGPLLMVMEKIEAPTLEESGISEDEAVDLAAKAVKWFLEQLPRVPETCYGRISSKSGCAMHPFFQDSEARRPFANPDDLADYISQICKLFPGGFKRPFSPTLAPLLTHMRENGRCIYHADITKNNFLYLGESGRKVCMIDFQHVGIFPQVFQTLAFFHLGTAFAARVGRKLGYEPLESDFASALGRIRCLLVMGARA